MTNEKKYIRRAVYLGLLLLMQVGFTLYGFFILLTIKAPLFLWGFWVIYQIIAWVYFFWQFHMITQDGKDLAKLSPLEELAETVGMWCEECPVEVQQVLHKIPDIEKQHYPHKFIEPDVRREALKHESIKV